jgi:hypothetical protein
MSGAKREIKLGSKKGVKSLRLLKNILTKKIVIPAKAGIQNMLKTLDSRFHGNDQKGYKNSSSTACLLMTKNIRSKIKGLSPRESLTASLHLLTDFLAGWV